LAFISRHHCQFLLDGNQVLVQDLESYNGTFVNGRPASPPLPVRHGDEVSLGPVSFRVMMQGGAQDTAEANLGSAPGQTAKLTPLEIPELPSGEVPSL
jgi:pSer/pThr/pTyr-binding forkhead associated (FHA) protein